MKMLVRLLMLVTLMGTAHADLIRDLFDPPVRCQGTVGYVQPNHFVLVSPDAQYLRVFVKQGELLPSSIVPGMMIQCSARVDENNLLRLETIDGMLTPTGQIAPVVSPPQSGKP